MIEFIKIEEYNPQSIDDNDFTWSDGYWDTIDGIEIIERYFIAVDSKNNSKVGFLTVGITGKCVAIEVRKGYKGLGIAKALVLKAQCFEPELNCNPSFWLKAKTWED